MRQFIRYLLVACTLVLASSAGAAQFYLFPLKELAGVSKEARASYPLLDPRVMAMLFDDASGRDVQRQLIDGFVHQLNGAYPDSLVHPRQVYDVKVGSSHRFVNDDSLQCKANPSVAVNETYAVVLGITRASIYTVEKGGNVEVLIPVTLNLQFVRPSLGKVVYTVNETVYSPFRFTREEYEAGTGNQVIRDTLVRNIGALAASLVKTASAGFNPRDESVKLAARDGAFYVTSRGAEAGFAKGEQVEASDAKGQVYLFDVLYADTGYAVVKPLVGSVSAGQELKFTFESRADASNKPRVMPVLPRGGKAPVTAMVADLFSKNLGFKATFQLDQVDVNFAQTKVLITRAANCVNWSNVAGMAESTRPAKDVPDYFLRFTPVATPSVTLAGSTGSRTAEMFHTLVTAQVVDKFGRVIYSGAGDDDYKIDRVDGEGLGLAQAREISLKNATGKLAANFVANVRFAPRDYKVVKADKQHVWVKGLAGAALGGKLTFRVLRSLDANVGGKPALLDLDVSDGAGDLLADGELVGVPYSVVNPDLPAPRSGDLLRLSMEAPVDATPVIDCAEPIFTSPHSTIDAPYLGPLIRHAIYQSTRFATYVGDEDFYADANQVLADGLFALQLQRPAVAQCIQPGYVIREEAIACEDERNCKSTVAMGMVARLKREGKLVKPYGTGVRTEFSGFPALSKAAFYMYRELATGLSMQAELTNKLNSN